MDVAISELRANLRTWVAKARAGDNVVVTERGLAVARLVPVDAADVLERLERDGTITPARAPKRRRATGRARVTATGSVSDIIAEQRR